MNLILPLALAASLALLPTVVRSGPGYNQMAENILQGGEAIQYLWHKVQEGFLQKWLPESLVDWQSDWRDFLHHDAELIIEDMYRTRFPHPSQANAANRAGYQGFLALTSPNGVNKYKVGTNSMKREVAETLIHEFARKQLKKPRDWPEVQSRYQDPQDESSLDANKRKRWGKLLRLGGSSTSRE